MEPTGTPATTPTPPGVLAAQDAIVFSGAGGEGVTPPGLAPTVAPTVAPAVAPTGTDVFWASLVRAQLCVWELQGAIEGQPDGGDCDRAPQDGQHHGHGATAGREATAQSVSHQWRGPGSTESISHQHVPTDGSISPKFMPMDGNISPKFTPMDGSISHKHQGRGSTYENIFHTSTGGSISHEHHGHVPADGRILPKFMPMDESIFHEHQGCGSTCEGIFHVSTGGSISPTSMPLDKNISPKSMPTDESIFHEHQGCGSTYESIFHVSTDGSVLPEHVLTDGTILPKSMPVDGSILHKHQGWGFAYESVSHVSMGGSISNEHCGHVPTDGSISPRSMSMDGSISPVSVPADETILQEHVPIDGTISPKSVPMDGTPSPKSMPMDGTISPKPVSMDGTISPKAMTMDGAISPEFMPMGGTTSPEHRDPECSEEEEEDADEDDDGCSSQEEEEDLEEEEPHFHTNPLFQSQVPAPMGAQRVPLYRPHGITLQPLLITEGDDATGDTGEGRGGVCVPHTLPPFGCCPVGGDVDGAAKQGPPRSPGLVLSNPPDLPLGSGDPPSPVRLQPEWGYRDPPRPPTPLELIAGGGDQEPPSPAYPPGLASGGGDQDLPLPRPPTPPKPPLGGGYQPPAGPLTPPDLPQGGEYQPPQPPPDLPQRGGYQSPTWTLTPPDLPQGGGYQPPAIPPDLPQRGGYPPHARPLTPPDLPQRGGYPPHARPLTPPDLPQRGGYQPPAIPPDLPQREGYQPPTWTLTPPDLPQGGGCQPPAIPPDLPQRGGYPPHARPLTPPDLPQGGGYKHPPTPLDLPQKGGCPPPARPPTPPDLPQRGGYQHPAKPLPPPDFSQRGGYQKPPSPLTPLSLPQPPPSPPYQPMRGGYQPSPNPLTPLDLPQPPPSPPTPPYHPLGGGYQPSPSPLPPLDHPQPPSPLSSLPPRGPPGRGVIGGARGGPPTLGHGCAWLPASPGAPCPGGEVAQAPPPATPPPHPDTEELPPETGDEPPPDPPASTHGCPPGGSAVTPTLANGEQGRRGEAQRLATRLFHLDGFKKSQVAAFLRKNNDFSGMVAQEYLDFFQFGGQTLDQALRSFLQALVLTGETQERERILGHFSRRYHRCNPGAFPSPDAVHSLTCAIMLLNTDLHGQRLGRAMTSSEFVANLSGMMDGQDFPREQLKALYGSIRSEKLAWAADEEEEEEEEEVSGGGSLAPLSRKKSNPFLDLPGGAGAVTYRRGWLARKVLAEADGKKTPWGRRGWKPFQAVLRGTVLYFLKPGGRTGVPRRPPDPGPFPDPQEEEGPEAEEPLGVHHALAERASKYTKRPNVFRLQTADWRVFLFQAPTPEEMSSWISRINLVAALYSSPPFPAAVGSQRRFVRPILPAAPSRSSPEEQHRSHEVWMERVAQELFEHQRNLPEKRGRARDLDEYRLKKEYLLYERRRYETYVQVLETWISTGAQDLEGWEAQAGPVVAPPDPPTLTKAHSSPSLVPEPPVAHTIRVKRNISERRTVRKIVPKRNKNLL